MIQPAAFSAIMRVGLFVLPLVIVGSWLGDRLARRLSAQTFGWLVGGLVLLSGVALLLK